VLRVRENPNLINLLVLMLQRLELKEKGKENLISEEETGTIAVQEVIVPQEEDLVIGQLAREEEIGIIEGEEKVMPEMESAFMTEDLELVEAKRSRKEVVEREIGERILMKRPGMMLLKERKQKKRLLHPPQLKEPQLKHLLRLRNLLKSLLAN